MKNYASLSSRRDDVSNYAARGAGLEACVYTMQDLVEASGYSKHTIYRLIRVGILERPTARSKYSRYTEKSMRRLLEYQRRMSERETAEDLIEQLGGDPDAYRRSRG